VIATFGDKHTEAVFHGEPATLIRRFPANLLRVAVRKLDLLNSARVLSELNAAPGNRLEALKGDLKGFHSIRVNNQWRLVFRWEGADAFDVRLADYH
jgi:proteic killer suppression protein